MDHGRGRQGSRTLCTRLHIILKTRLRDGTSQLVHRIIFLGRWAKAAPAVPRQSSETSGSSLRVAIRITRNADSAGKNHRTSIPY